ncbi:MAG TPA: hypothetical protein VFF06_25420 [Polyangia bacterium]|nr:hypothetical protein [Polyangia bacterium]
MRARASLLFCALVAGCGHAASRAPFLPCAQYYRAYAGGKGGTEFYRLAGEEITSTELRARLLADPRSHDRTVVARRLWWAGWALLAADLATTVAGFTLAVSSKATQTPGIGLAVAGALNVAPILIGVFGTSRVLFHRAMEDYNHDAGVRNACPP